MSEFYLEHEGLIALFGSHDTLEIAYSKGDAASHLNAKIGDEVRIISRFR